MAENATIFAAATPIGESSISIIRISGNKAFEIVSRVFSKAKKKFSPENISNLPSHTIHHGYIFDDDELVDEVVLFLFEYPNSFTGEDVIEISSHGGSYVYRKLSSLLVKHGGVHAEPGEFSKRAFLNGKIDLVQAEAIADLIRAKTELASKSALKQLEGELSSKINELRNNLINYCSLVELELDFSEEGLELVRKDELLQKLDAISEDIKKMCNSYQSGRIIKDGINLAIVGEPNVGKSTIFNYLLQESRAIVSEIPGTTRDYLEEQLILGGFVFNLIDTAGIHATSDVIEQEGVKRSHKKMDEADIILKVSDLSNGAAGENVNISSNGKDIKVFNKLDIAKSEPNEGICVSAKTGKNMDILSKSVIEKAKTLTYDESNSEVYVTNERHAACLLKSCEYLRSARDLILEDKGNELISFEIREAMSALGEIIGKTTNSDVLNNIFAKFCIGK
jgi:tRNA modification GTPase